jgi:F-type H+-transporting ATPase subunit b
MRSAFLSLGLLAAMASPVLAQEPAAESTNLLEPHAGLMLITLLIFAVLLFVLSKYAFPPILAAVEERERKLEEAIEGAKRDREEAARLLEEHRLQMEQARAEAQRMIGEGRAAGEKLRGEMLEQTRQQQEELLERARRELGIERDRAIAALRREAVELAIVGASKVIEKNLDDQANRRLVETYLGSLDAPMAK